jgi:hypothetical protein
MQLIWIELIESAIKLLNAGATLLDMLGKMCLLKQVTCVNIVLCFHLKLEVDRLVIIANHFHTHFSIPELTSGRERDWLVDWLWWGKTDVSELRPLQAFCSSLGDLPCGPWIWYWLGLTPILCTITLWQPPVLSGGPVSRNISVTAPSTGWFPVSRDISGSHQYSLVSSHLRHLWSKWAKEMRIYSNRSRGSSRDLLDAVKSYDMGPTTLLSIRRKVCCGFLLPSKIHCLGRARTRDFWL